ncbi:MAG: N-acetyltransferase, partial [Bacteroidales bacterium]
MAITIEEVKGLADIKEFVDFQFRLYKGNKYWVPPIKSEEVKSLLPEKNPCFTFCDVKLWLAKKD